MAEPTKISIVLEALDRARAEIAGTAQEINSLGAEGQKANEHFRETPGALASIKEQLLGIGEEVAAAFAVVQIVEFINRTEEASVALLEFAEVIGTSVETLSKRTFAALQSGLSEQKFDQALKTLSLKISEAIENPASRIAEVFRTLGVKIQDGLGNERGTIAVFDDIATAISHFEDGSRKAAVTTDLFGTRMAGIIPLLNKGKSGLDELGRAAEEMGAVATGKGAEAAKEFEVELGNLKKVTEGLALSFGTAILPALTDVTKALVDTAKQAGGFKDIFGAVGTILGVVSLNVLNLIDHFNALGSTIGKTLAAMNELAHGRLAGVGAIGDDLANEINALQARTEAREKLAEALLSGKKSEDENKLPKLGENNGAPGGQIAVPDILLREEAIKRQIAKTDADRAAAETAYRVSVLNTQNSLDSGAITATQAFNDNRAAAQTLLDKLVDINGNATRYYETLQAQIRLDLTGVQKVYNDTLKNTSDELVAQNITIEEAIALDKIAAEQRDRKLVNLRAQAAAIDAQKSKALTDVLTGTNAVTKPRFEGPQNFSQGLDEFTTGLGDTSSRIRGVISGINAEISTVASGITGLITGTQTWGQAFSKVGLSILNTLVEITLQTLVQSAIRTAIGTTETAHHAAQVGTQVAVHGTGEAAKTTTTGAGAVSRGIIRVAETIWHGVQVTAKVVAHVAGEIFMTAVTLAQSALRIVSILFEAGKYIIVAAIKAMSAVADIPYVGPILAIAALAAVLAAGAAALGAFEDGGYTGPGPKSKAAGIVHAGEFVFTQEATDRIGVNNLYAMMNAAQAGKPPVLGALSAAPLRGYAGGGFVAPSQSNPVHINMALVNSRQEQRDFQAKTGIKMTLDYMRQRQSRRTV